MPRRNARRTPTGLGNRTDLVASNLPTGQAYGARTDQAAALKAVPAAPPPTSTAPPVPQQDPMAAAAAMPFAPVGLGNPSTRPDEPVTAGVPSGPGPNTIAQPPMPPSGPNPDVLLFSKWMPALEILANAPTASSETRQFYRRLRSQMPVGASPNVQAGRDQAAAALNAQGL